MPNKGPFLLQLQQGVVDNCAHDSEIEFEIEPLVESKLRSLTLIGLWVMPMDNLAKVLTIYAPNLVYLEVGSIHAKLYVQNDPWLGLDFLKTVDDAVGLDGPDQENEVETDAASSTSSEAFKPGHRLKQIVSRYSVDYEGATRMEFVDAGPPDRMQLYHELGIRVFEFRYEVGLVRVEAEMGDTFEDEGDDSP